MNKSKLKFWLIPSILLIAVLVISRSGLFSASKAQSKDTPNALSVNAVQVQNMQKVPKLTLTGSIEGLTSATVSAKIAGRIEEVLVQEGQVVQAGQPLVRLESVELANSSRMARDTVTKAQANYDNALADFNRYQSLYEKGAISEQQLDSLQTKLKIAQADLSSAMSSLQNAQQQYGYGVITAPVDGVVANKMATVGQVISPGAALMNVANIGQVYAVVNIEQKDLGLVKSGQKANVLVDAYPDRAFEGTVELMNPEAGSASRMFRTKIKVDNPEELLKPGMFVKVELKTGEAAEVLAVPQAAVIHKQGLNYVFTLEQNKVVRCQVEIGDILGNSIEIRSGLTAGERVVISNVSLLKDGDIVRITE